MFFFLHMHIFAESFCEVNKPKTFCSLRKLGVELVCFFNYEHFWPLHTLITSIRKWSTHLSC